MSIKAIVGTITIIIGVVGLLIFSWNFKSNTDKFQEGEIKSGEYLERTLKDSVDVMTPEEVNIMQFFGPTILGVLVVIAFLRLSGKI